MNRHAGYSLVEMTIACTLMVVLLGLSASPLHSMMQARWRQRELFELHQTLPRLSEQFRGDVHRAQTATPQDGQQRLMLHMEDGSQIEYIQQSAIIVRTHTADGKLPHREGFRLPESMQTRWVIEPQLPLVRLELWSESHPAPAGVAYSIEAQPGKYLRFQRAAEPTP